MRTLDYSPLYRSIVGFDRLANMINSASKSDPSAGFPPYNIEQLGENDYRIELAVAGFGEDDLTVEVQENVLTVSGRKESQSEDEGPNYLYRGIAERAFERRFHLADHVVVDNAETEKRPSGGHASPGNPGKREAAPYRNRPVRRQSPQGDRRR